jgi:uncharacterized damage-inducible protein DinB
MQETPQEYTQRILANLDSQAASRNALHVQAETPARLARLIEGLPASRLHERPAPGKWSAAEILAHLAEAEIVTSWRIRHILGASGTPIQAYDQNSWATAGHYERRDPRKSLEQLRVLREANLDLFASLAPEQWTYYGIHAERGKETIEHITRLTAGHDLNHTKQIEALLAERK